MMIKPIRAFLLATGICFCAYIIATPGSQIVCALCGGMAIAAYVYTGYWE